MSEQTPLTPSSDSAEQGTAVARILSDIRKANAWTLSEVSKKTGVAISTLSKIENGQTQPAYSVLTRLAAGLNIDFVDLLGGNQHPKFAGASRSITRKGEGRRFANDMGLYEALGTDLAAKSLQPMLIEVLPQSPDSPHVRSAHRGEEFVYVLAGPVVFEMNPHSPTVLETGDSVYFDGAMDHGFYAAGSQNGRILSVCFTGSTAPSAETSAQ